MLQTSAPSETLAHWHYTPNDWREFVNYELQAQMKIYKSYRNGFIGIIVVAGLIMVSLVLIPFLTMGIIWRADVWGPVIGVAFVAGILLAVVGIYWLLSRHKISRLKLSTGNVYITLTGVSVNGVWFNWGYEKFGWRLHNVRRKTLAVVEGRKIEILEFKCSAHNRGSRVNEHMSKAERVLIPAGKDTEAERIIERLLAEKNRFANNYAY